MLTPDFASNMNFPAPLAVLAFLAACAGSFLAIASAGIAWFSRKPKWALACMRVVSAGAILYLALLVGFSLASRNKILARAQEKYFCEIDCHLAYSVLDVETEPASGSTRYTVPSARGSTKPPRLRAGQRTRRSRPLLASSAWSTTPATGTCPLRSRAHPCSLL